MIGGEFHRKNVKTGEVMVHKNHFTTVGMTQLVKRAFWGIDLTWYIGLCAHAQSDSVALGAMLEPTIGYNGYARVAMPVLQNQWPTVQTVNGEVYAETIAFTFSPTGDGFDNTVNRLFVTDGEYVIAISSEIDGGPQRFTEDWVNQYRLYFR